MATLCLPRPSRGWRREALCQEGWTESRLFSNWQKNRTDLWGEKGDTNTGKYKETQGGCEKNERRLHNGGKGALCSLVTAEKDLQGLFFFYALTNWMNKVSLFSWLTELNKQTDLKGQHSLLCLYVADSATFLASNSVLGPCFSSEDSLFTQSWKKIHISEFVSVLLKIEILSFDFLLHSYTVPCNKSRGRNTQIK